MIAASPDEDRVLRLVRAYLAAGYRWQHEGSWHPLTIGEPATAPEAAFPQARGFGLLSAWNPDSVERPERINRDADATLQQLLRATGRAFLPACAAARDDCWREPGWLIVGIEPDALDALARRFGQLGALYAARGGPVRLRVYRRAPAAGADLRDIDWVE